MGQEYYKKYLKSRTKFLQKLSSVQRSTQRFLLISVALMTLFTTLAIFLGITVTSHLVALFQHCCRQRYRRLPTSDSVIPAYIIGGQLFVDTSRRKQQDTNFNNDDDNSLLLRKPPSTIQADESLENTSSSQEKKSISRAVRNRLLSSSASKYYRGGAAADLGDYDDDPEAPGHLVELSSTTTPSNKLA
eukprot:CAMPEP_0197341936 /NCGR_PEP_ID=MMETSP0892-20130614/46582_1 /TAXON_ID=44058 ORGANISM="Aureoumbra lagunensis, Strain CCMP1510" /NCGR_SAMPLE_ID=MMETSP0892 /ASSEMBLY_ACC=CAM_ASM_000538 /LENGTH=188 /DNA_ID=CAMNT_0042847005 /DNA_START=514 /DNA_END=1080 /DNA_ORIENTATION=+